VALTIEPGVIAELNKWIHSPLWRMNLVLFRIAPGNGNFG